MNEIQARQLLNIKTRTDLATFIHRTFQTVSPAQPYQHNWHIEAMAWHLQQCMEGRITRLLITLPPRYLKSICASVAFPAWVLGRIPSKRIVCVSYSADLAGKHARDCRAVMQTDWYRKAFPTLISPDKNAELDFDTTDHGGRFSTSVGGTLTGRGGDLIIIDDPIKPADAMSESCRSAANEWFDRTLYSRLNNKRDDVIILIMQRLHVEDLAGYVLAKEPWTHLNLPAIAETEQKIRIAANACRTRHIGEVLHEAREDRQVLDGIKASLGSFNFSSQYQQAPIPPDGELIKWDWFRRFDQLPHLEPHDRIVQSWDTASTANELSDFSVCTTWYVKGKDYYLVDVLREKLIFPALKRKVIEHAVQHRAGTIVIEDKGSGTSLIQDLSHDSTEGVPYPIAFAPEHDKITRMSSQSSKIESGHVYLPQRAAWLDDFRDELLQFPHGGHGDQADSVSQFLNWIDRSPGEWVGGAADFPLAVVTAPRLKTNIVWRCRGSHQRYTMAAAAGSERQEGICAPGLYDPTGRIQADRHFGNQCKLQGPARPSGVESAADLAPGAKGSRQVSGNLRERSDDARVHQADDRSPRRNKSS